MSIVKGTINTEKPVYTLKYDGIGISGEVFASAVLFNASGKCVIESADLITEPEWDRNGDYTGLVMGLLACCHMEVTQVKVFGHVQLENNEEISKFMVELFQNFDYVDSTVVGREENSEAYALTEEIIKSRQHFVRRF